MTDVITIVMIVMTVIVVMMFVIRAVATLVMIGAHFVAHPVQ